jgi:toxin YoeB
MEIGYTDVAKEHLRYWHKSGNKSVQTKISDLLESIVKTPFLGIGKPEPLKYELAGKWSRRITKEHRLVYEIDEENKLIIIHALKGHY